VHEVDCNAWSHNTGDFTVVRRLNNRCGCQRSRKCGDRELRLRLRVRRCTWNHRNARDRWYGVENWPETRVVCIELDEAKLRGTCICCVLRVGCAVMSVSADILTELSRDEDVPSNIGTLNMTRYLSSLFLIDSQLFLRYTACLRINTSTSSIALSALRYRRRTTAR
jgi:hypothetical protein